MELLHCVVTSQCCNNSKCDQKAVLLGIPNFNNPHDIDWVKLLFQMDIIMIFTHWNVKRPSISKLLWYRVASIVAMIKLHFECDACDVFMCHWWWWWWWWWWGGGWGVGWGGWVGGLGVGGCLPGHIFHSPYVPRLMISGATFPMFPSPYVPEKCFPVMLLPKPILVSPYFPHLCSPKYPIPMFSPYVLQSVCFPGPMLPRPYVPQSLSPHPQPLCIRSLPPPQSYFP